MVDEKTVLLKPDMTWKSGPTKSQSEDFRTKTRQKNH